MIYRNAYSITFAICALFLCMGNLTGEEKSEKLMVQSDGLISENILNHASLTATQKYLDDTDDLHLLHPAAVYHAVGVTTWGDQIQLQDGSTWYVHPQQRHLVKTWVQQDILFVKPNASCFSAYRYVLQNRTTEHVVEVSLLYAPAEMGPYTFWITDIDSYNRIVFLNDGSIWHINPSEYSFNKWQIGQRLILGVNNSWRRATYPHILINAGLYNAPYCEAHLSY